MLLKACPRCKRMIPHGLPYCDTCAPIAQAERAAAQERKAEYKRRKYNRQYNRQRDPKYLAFYRSGPWKNTSRTKLQDADYKCEAKLDGCKGLACEVHHIKALKTAEGWERRLDWDNLQAVCTSCHNQLDKRFGSQPEPGVLDMREIMKKL